MGTAREQKTGNFQPGFPDAPRNLRRHAAPDRRFDRQVASIYGTWKKNGVGPGYASRGVEDVATDHRSIVDHVKHVFGALDRGEPLPAPFGVTVDAAGAAFVSGVRVATLKDLQRVVRDRGPAILFTGCQGTLDRINADDNYGIRFDGCVDLYWIRRDQMASAVKVVA